MDNAKEILPPDHWEQWERAPKTKWHNPLETVQTLPIRVAVGKTAWGADVCKEVTVTVPARGAALIPTRYDYAIHVVRSGQVVAGLAPLLIKEGQTYPLARHLIPPAVKPRADSVDVSDLRTILATGRTAAEEAFLGRAK